jgi:CheY-like chemotaxis protein
MLVFGSVDPAMWNRSLDPGECMTHTILIVDDDHDIREALADVLGDNGYAVAAAGDGLEALAYLRENPAPSMILLDWMMPKCNGAQFRAQQLEDPTLAKIPVVLLTADVSLEDKTRQLDARAYLAKPVSLEHLLAVVARVCG